MKWKLFEGWYQATPRILKVCSFSPNIENDSILSPKCLIFFGRANIQIELRFRMMVRYIKWLKYRCSSLYTCFLSPRQNRNLISDKENSWIRFPGSISNERFGTFLRCGAQYEDFICLFNFEKILQNDSLEWQIVYIRS